MPDGAGPETREGTAITFTPLPIIGTIGCCVPVLPGTPDAEVPLEERTELCAMDANWLIGMVPTCDHHARLVCEMTEIDWPGVLAEAGRKSEREWQREKRHSQEDTRKHREHFSEYCR